MTGWDGFGEGLAEQLTTLATGSVLIISESGPTGRYAQFLQSDESLSAELVGDHYLDPSVRAGEPGCRLIAEAGWRQPEDTVHGHNWQAELPWPSPSAAYHRLAAMTVTGLRDALRITSPQTLVYDAWGRENHPLRLPLLGLTPKT
ncbi:hypothetical protein [Streptomyces sp. NBC_00059]|uniref:TY-Chap domain-containing protein n=1 Tax=Streptomyces sp. NBC_00059 TaxID=2975635 RepID=UPI00225A70D0|nr:hypothetical protein [Streptomyces sp. NBC_00059]MCX5414950.1 hypothetical protein [Streptomyces sp. NBC_00059]